MLEVTQIDSVGSFIGSIFVIEKEQYRVVWGFSKTLSVLICMESSKCWVQNRIGGPVL